MPKICLLPTASGDGEAQIRQFHATFGARNCEPMHISLFRLGSRPIPLRETLLDAGHHLRRRRLDARPARRLARARAGRDPARGVGVGRDPRRALARARCAGSSGASRSRSATRALARPRLPARLDVGAHGRRARAPADLPRGDRRRHDPARLRRRRRRRAALPRHRARGGRQLAPEPPRAAPRPDRGRGGARAAPARGRRPLRPDARDRRVPPRARAHRAEGADRAPAARPAPARGGGP